jgi:outer membrane protein assembly factor BamA
MVLRSRSLVSIGGLALLALTSASAATEDRPASDALASDVSLSTTTLWAAPLDSPASDVQDPERDATDTSEWLVAPIPFKSSMLGYGLKLGVARLSRHSDSSRESMLGAGGMYAEGGSWAAGAFDRSYWRGDHWRSTVAVATGELNYELSLSQQHANARLPVSQRASGGVVGIERNILEHGWIGGGIGYARSSVRVDGVPDAVDNLLSVTYTSRALRLNGKWDTRSDSFYPQQGLLAVIDIDFVSNEAAGRRTRFTRYDLSYNGYRTIAANQVLAWRARVATVVGDAPFFALPWFGAGADLRGYSPGRYIGRSLAAAQAEWRWQTFSRLGLVVFAGIGGVYGEVKPFEQDGSLPAAGAGLRWRLTHENRINFVIDYARGRDDSTVTISVGEAF